MLTGSPNGPGLDRSTLAALAAARAPGLRERAARAAMRERLALAVERYDGGDTTSDLNVIDSWVQHVRELFDLMPAEGEEAAAAIARRMAAVPQAYRQFSQTLLGAARKGRPPARLQVEEVIAECMRLALGLSQQANLDAEVLVLYSSVLESGVCLECGQGWACGWPSEFRSRKGWAAHDRANLAKGCCPVPGLPAKLRRL